MTTILVTGATGYLGGRVMDALAAVGVSAIGCSRGNGLHRQCDLEDRRATVKLIRECGSATVIHCAAIVPKSDDGYADGAAGARSLAMTENLITGRPRRIVFASSMTVYPACARIPVTEEDAGDPGNDYAGYKRRAEIALCRADESTATIFRLPGLFGRPRAGGLLFNAARSLACGQCPALPDKAPMWSGFHVDDAADLLVRAAVAGEGSTIILNAGYPVPMSVTETVRALARKSGVAMSEGPDAIPFEMDLTKLAATFGLPEKSLDERLDELVFEARMDRERSHD